MYKWNADDADLLRLIMIFILPYHKNQRHQRSIIIIIKDENTGF